MDKKAIKWIVLLGLVPLLCLVGKSLKEKYDMSKSMSAFSPAVFSEFDIYADAEKADAQRDEIIYKININTASSEQLRTLDGIGEKTAEKIIQFREDYGGFKNIEEIQLVDDIGEKTFSKISKYLTVE